MGKKVPENDCKCSRERREKVRRPTRPKAAKKAARNIPRFRNFLTQVLYSIQIIQSNEMQNPSVNGVTIDKICVFMRKKFGANGDVESRVKTAILKAKKDGFCLEECGTVTLVTPLARIQNAKTRTERCTVIREMKQIFLYRPNLNEFTPHDEPNVLDATTSTTKRRLRQLKRTDIPYVLQNIESILMQQVGISSEENSRCETRPLSAKKKKVELKSSDLSITQLPRGSRKRKRSRAISRHSSASGEYRCKCRCKECGLEKSVSLKMPVMEQVGVQTDQSPAKSAKVRAPKQPPKRRRKKAAYWLRSNKCKP